MKGAFRLVGFADLRHPIEDVAMISVSDEELAARGVPLADEETLRDGLGPSRYAVLELSTGEQYVLQRLLLSPVDGVVVAAGLTGDSTVLTDRLLDTLGIPYDHVSWRIEAQDWERMLDAYRTRAAG